VGQRAQYGVKNCSQAIRRRTSDTTATVKILVESARDEVHAELLLGDEPAGRLVVTVEERDVGVDTGRDVGVGTGGDVAGVAVPVLGDSGPVVVVVPVP
jgi:hypothetical protein